MHTNLRDQAWRTICSGTFRPIIILSKPVFSEKEGYLGVFDVRNIEIVKLGFVIPVRISEINLPED
jgi:hypothetical protein